MYLWRRLTNAKLTYSNIEKEIVWMTTRTLQFLTRQKQFLLRCDQRPLECIYNPRKELLKASMPKMLRWAIRMMAFDFKYIRANSVSHLDVLSRVWFYKESSKNTRQILDIFSNIYHFFSPPPTKENFYN